MVTSQSTHTMPFPEQFDVWSVGVTVLEILSQEGTSFCSRLGGDLPAIKEKLASLNEEVIAKYINQRVVGNSFEKRAERAFLFATLAIKPKDRFKAADLMEVIKGECLGGRTASGKAVADGLQQITEAISALQSLLLDKLDGFQSHTIQALTSITVLAQGNSAQLASTMETLSATHRSIDQVYSKLDAAPSVTALQQVLREDMHTVLSGFASKLKDAADSSAVQQLIAEQRDQILSELRKVDTTLQSNQHCTSKQLEGLKDTVRSKIGGVQDHLQLVLDEMKKLQSAVHCIESSQSAVRDSFKRYLLNEEAEREEREKQKEEGDGREGDGDSALTAAMIQQAVLQAVNEAVAKINQPNPSSLTAADSVQAVQAELQRGLASLHTLQGQIKSALLAEVHQCVCASLEQTAALKQAGVEDARQEFAAMKDALLTLQGDMSFLMQEQQRQGGELREMRVELHRQTNLLQTLVLGQHRVPKLMILVPKARKSMVGKFKSLWTDKYHIYFICPISLQRGYPYELTLPKQWVLQALPVVKMTLFVLKVALICAGLPLPGLDALPSLLMDGALSQANAVANALPLDRAKEALASLCEKIEALQSEVEKEAADNNSGGDSSLMQGLNTAMQKLNVADNTLLHTDTVNEVLAQLNQFNLDSNYAAIYDLLRDTLEQTAGKTKDSEWKPQQTGLELVTSAKDGSSAWILKNPSVRQSFDKEGKGAIRA